MLRFFRFWCFLFLALGPAWAQAVPPVEWSVQISGDTLTIDAKTAAPQPAQRLNGSPTYLELSFPKAKLAGSALSKAVDRGLIQKVQTSQEGQGTSVKIFVLSKPKATLTKTGEGYRYSIKMSEIAGSTPVASKPAAETKPEPPVAQPQPPVAKPEPPVAQPKPPVAKPEPPVAQPKPPAAKPEPPQVATASPSNDKARKPITVVFQNKPIGEAVRELATLAGYTAQLDPALSGVVNLSLSDVPFEDALTLLLEPYGSSISTTVGSDSISVRKVASSTPSSSPSTATSAGEDIVFEYYPFTTKDAQKVMDATSKAVPELTYRVDPTLNILLVQGPREHVVRLGELLKKMSSK